MDENKEPEIQRAICVLSTLTPHEMNKNTDNDLDVRLFKIYEYQGLVPVVVPIMMAIREIEFF